MGRKGVVWFGGAVLLLGIWCSLRADTAVRFETVAGNPKSADNFAYVGNGAQPAVASSEYPLDIHRATSLNDGVYGNGNSWISRPGDVGPNFTIDLAKTRTVSCFKLGRDRLGRYDDRFLTFIVIEVSADGKKWQSVYKNDNVNALPTYSSLNTMVIEVPPVECRYIKVSVEDQVCLDEFEVYGPADRK